MRYFTDLQIQYLQETITGELTNLAGLKAIAYDAMVNDREDILAVLQTIIDSSQSKVTAMADLFQFMQTEKQAGDTSEKGYQDLLDKLGPEDKQ